MALVKCEDCGREISASAHSCPGCGRPLSVVRSTRMNPWSAVKAFVALCCLMVLALSLPFVASEIEDAARMGKFYYAPWKVPMWAAFFAPVAIIAALARRRRR